MVYLKDEDGNKRYCHGPAVVFPEPTETFVETPKGGNIFRALELKNIKGFNNQTFYAELIQGQYNLFYSVAESYFILKPKDTGLSLFSPISAMLINNVKANELLDPDNPKSYFNIIVKYMNNGKLDSSLIPLIERIEFKATADLFYAIPMIIYCLESMIKNLMS